MKIADINENDRGWVNRMQAEINRFVGVDLNKQTTATCECGEVVAQRFAKRAVIKWNKKNQFGIVRSWKCHSCGKFVYGSLADDPMVPVSNIWGYPELLSQIVEATCQTAYQYKFWKKHLLSKSEYPTLWVPEFAQVANGMLYFVDFYDLKGSAIELDGNTHLGEAAEEKDAKKTQDLNSVGIKVARLWA